MRQVLHKNLHKRCSRLIEKLDEHQDKLNIEKGTTMRGVLEEASQYVNKNLNASNKEVCSFF